MRFNNKAACTFVVLLRHCAKNLYILSSYRYHHSREIAALHGLKAKCRLRYRRGLRGKFQTQKRERSKRPVPPPLQNDTHTIHTTTQHCMRRKKHATLSVSSSAIASPGLILSPTFFSHDAMLPCARCSYSGGCSNYMAINVALPPQHKHEHGCNKNRKHNG
jgi:hypothetical protein